MRVATIDIGTNSVLLLVAERRNGAVVPVLERATITRLGRGVDKTRVFDPAAVEATLACLAAYAEEIRGAGVTRVDVVGTSAMRDARGGEDFRDRAAALLGVAPRIISGHEEAELTFAGALSGLEIEGPALVFDLGGGSTELIRGEVRAGVSTLASALSIDVGSVRLTERCLPSDPPSTAEIAEVRRTTRALLDAALVTLGAPVTPVAPEPAAQLVGVAGTVTTLAAYALGVAPYDPSRIHGARISAETIARSAHDLAALTVAQRRALPTIDPKRADVIVAGAVITDEILTWSRPFTRGDLLVSDRGVRWGLAARLLEGSTIAASGP
jgi:exopolyphosphatase/guanosine-5'-triphosphate,3'-diphosphate pyrophosphatase